jgi:hypothetical protein
MSCVRLFNVKRQSPLVGKGASHAIPRFHLGSVHVESVQQSRQWAYRKFFRQAASLARPDWDVEIGRGLRHVLFRATSGGIGGDKYRHSLVRTA